MYQDLDEFDKLMNAVESNSTELPKKPNYESALDLSSYDLEPVTESILRNGINRVSNLLSADLKSKISNEWKHLDEDERKLLLRIISGDSSVFSDENSNIDVSLARAFKDKTLLPAKTEEDGAGIVINKNVDLANSGATAFPDISIVEVKGDVKCSYSSFVSFRYFPKKVKSLEFVKGKNQIETLEGLPETTGKNDANYSIDLKFTKLNSLKGWKSKTPIKGNVSFRGCDLKDVAVDSPIYVGGILDIRDNPNISIETLKAILLKDYSKNQIIVKGGIYHTLESDGYYSSGKIKKDEFVNEDLSGILNEAMGVNRAGVLVPQEELWKIGPEIIRQAELKKGKKANDSAKINLAQKIKPEVQGLIKNMASTQLDKNSVANASQKIVNGMSSDEFRKLMKGLFDNLLKQLTSMMHNTNGGDSSQVDKSVETITNVAAENITDRIEEFAKTIDADLQSDSCLDLNRINNDLIEIIKSVPEIGSGDLKILQKRVESLIKLKESDNRDQYKTILGNFLNLLYVGILDKNEISENTINKVVDNCLGEAKEEVAPEAKPQETAPEPPAQAPQAEPQPEPTSAPAPAAKPAPAPKQPTKPAAPKPKSSLLANAVTKKAEIPSSVTNAVSNSKTSKGLSRFQQIIGTASTAKVNPEDK